MKELTGFFGLMSNETRLRIVMLLEEDELCVCQISDILKLSQPKVSKHLAKLKGNGFINYKKDKQFVFYSLEFENEIFKNLILNIKNEIDEYPILKEDKERLLNKRKEGDIIV